MNTHRHQAAADALNLSHTAYHRTSVTLDLIQSELLACINTGDLQQLEWVEENLADLRTEIRSMNNIRDCDGVWVFESLLMRYADQVESMLPTFRMRDQAKGEAAYNTLLDMKSAVSSYYSYIDPNVTDHVIHRYSLINQQYNRQNRILLLVVLCTGLLIFSVSVILLDRLFRPIQQLTSYAHSIDLDHLEVMHDTRVSDNEAGVLITAFRQMIERLKADKLAAEEKRAVEQQLREERSQRIDLEGRVAQMQLRALQSQINSHFLFNSMNMVSKLAYLENAPRSQEASEHIALFLRGALNQFDRRVTMQEEFDLTDQYVEIQKLRFADRIRFSHELDSECASEEIVPMILQPLVENAISHGVGSLPSGGYVFYYAKRCPGGFRIGVEDNGDGFTEEERQRVTEHCSSQHFDPSSDEGIGMVNVYRKLMLLYGTRVSLSISSVPQKLTVVEFTVRDEPKQDEDERKG